MIINNEQPIIFFDGICNLCNGSVQVILKIDKKNCFLFSSLQSEFAQQNLKHFLNENPNIDSVILLLNGKIYTKSEAAFEIIRQIGGFWKILLLFRIFPLSFRNFIYDFIGKNRYKWFGKKESCMLPKPEFKNRFLE